MLLWVFMSFLERKMGTSVSFAFPRWRIQKYLSARETCRIWVTISIGYFQRPCVLCFPLDLLLSWPQFSILCSVCGSIPPLSAQSSRAAFPRLTLGTSTLLPYHILNIKTISIPESLVWDDRQVNTKTTRTRNTGTVLPGIRFLWEALVLLQQLLVFYRHCGSSDF